MNQKSPKTKGQGRSGALSRVYLLLIVIVPLALFLPSLRNGFVYLDDDILVLENQAKISGFHDIGKVFRSDAFLNNSSPYYRPLLNVSLAFDAQFGKTAPGAYHFMNLLYHILCCLSLFWLLQLLGLERGKAFVGAMIFAVHPIMAGAVFWIPARSDLLVALFGMLYMAPGIKYAGGRHPLWLAVSVLCFGLALFSKESAVLLPLLLGLYLLFTGRNRNRILALFFCPAVLAAVWFYLRSISVKMIGAEQLGFSSILKNMPFPFEVLARFFFPWSLPVAPVYSNMVTAAGILVAMLFPVAFFIRKEKAPVLFLLGIAWFIAFSLPNMYVWLQTSPDSYEYLLHRAYLPLAGLLVSLLAIIPGKWVNPANRWCVAGFCALVVALSAASFLQGRKYHDAKTFWNSAIADNPGRAWNYHFLGRYYFKQQDFREFENYTRRAISLKADPRFLYNLGLVCFLGKKQYDTAFILFNRALAMGLKGQEVLKNYSDLCIESARDLFNRGAYAKAVERCMIGVRLDTANAVAAYNLGLYLAYSGDTKSAATWWYRTLRLDPELKEAYRSLYFYYLMNTSLTDSVNRFAAEYRKRGGIIEPPAK